jgi:hypothetical protein
MLDRVGVTEGRPHPDLAIAANLHGTSRHIVSPQIESAAACQLEARMMPMTRKDTVLDTAPIQWETHMRAAIVERENMSVFVNQENWAMAAVDNDPPPGLQLLKAGRVNEVRILAIAHQRLVLSVCPRANLFTFSRALPRNQMPPHTAPRSDSIRCRGASDHEAREAVGA